MNSIQYIQDNIHLLDNYDRMELCKKLYSKNFKTLTGLPFENSGVCSYITYRSLPDKNGVCTPVTFCLDFEQTYEHNLQRLKDILAAKGTTIEEAKNVIEMSYSLGQVYFLDGGKMRLRHYFSNPEKDAADYIEAVLGMRPVLKVYKNGNIDHNLSPGQVAEFVRLKNILESVLKY